jgi:endonuclease/exonuclease/phosphatase family metal-dependent hydrolase
MKRASRGRIKSQCLLVVGMLIATAFAQDHPAHAQAHSFLTIMTRNMDEGTDFGFIAAAAAIGDPALFPVALTETFCEVVASNPELRAAQIADEIAAAQPDLVSLQEVAVWQSSLLFCPGAAIGPPTTIDAETALLNRLAVDGVSYHVVSQLDEFSSTSIPGLPFSFLDRDVLLARDEPDGQLSIANVQAQHFSTLLTVPLPLPLIPPPGLNLTILRGWISADVTVRGRTVRVIATHLQNRFGPSRAGEPVQEAQAEELVTGPAATSLPVVIAGDLNTGPGSDLILTYNLLTQNAGFTDTWTATQPNDPGFTDFFYTEDPPTPSTPSMRIDLILVRGAVVPSAPKDYLVGTEVPHPSDHAGVVAKVTIP